MNYPDRACIIEVGPRDGFQNLAVAVATPEKLALIAEIVRAGVTAVEVTSFPAPREIPQLADGETVLRAVKDHHRDKVRCIVSAMSCEGAAAAAGLGADTVSYIVSAGDKHHQQLTCQSPAQSLAGFAAFCRLKSGARARLSISAAFASPHDGQTAPAAVLRLLEAGLRAGADEFNLADTTGTANPLQTMALLREVAANFAGVPVTLHFHDTQGMGLANVFSAFSLGFASFEASVGGLGGNPLRPLAAGNIATEDVVNMFAAMGVATGIDPVPLIAAARNLRAALPVNLSGHLINT